MSNSIHTKGKRIKFSPSQKRRLAEKGGKLGRKALAKIANLVTPTTIYAWHLKFVAIKFASKGKDHSAAHARREERNALIIKLATVPRKRSDDKSRRRPNAGWGYGRIQGVMQNLGWHKISTSTIGEVLRGAGVSPSPERSSRIDWKTFIRIHADQLAATDFFMVPVWTLKGLAMYRVHLFCCAYACECRRLRSSVVIDLLTRKIEITHIGCQYSGELMLQIGRNLTDAFDGFLLGKKYMLHDQDPLFTQAFRELIRNSGTIPFKLPRQMPMMNGHAECFVKSIKSECLDKLIFFGEDSLQNAIDQYMAHYHHERPHQGLDNKVIEPDAETFKNQGDGAKRRWANAQRLGRSPEPKASQIQKIARLGGLLNHYYRDPIPDFENEEAKAA